jgi:hypothetical protein
MGCVATKAKKNNDGHGERGRIGRGKVCASLCLKRRMRASMPRREKNLQQRGESTRIPEMSYNRKSVMAIEKEYFNRKERCVLK